MPTLGRSIYGTGNKDFTRTTIHLGQIIDGRIEQSIAHDFSTIVAERLYA